jgi:NTE family protein
MRYRLRLLATDLTSIRLIVLPDDLPDYEDAEGRPIDPDRFPLADAVRMSMSSAILFEPFQLRRNGHAHFVVDGGVLSPFPVWLFDRPQAKRPTFGFLIAAPDSEEEYRPIPRLFGVFRLLVAMFRGIVRTRDREKMTRSDSIRTVAISAPSRAITYRLSRRDSSLLHENGRAAARAFFSVQREYVNSYGPSSGTVVVPSASPTEVSLP